MTDKEYNKYVMKKMKKSTIVKDTAIAFLVGGGICAAAEFIKQLLLDFGMDKQPASTALTIILIGIGGLLTGLGLYCKIGKAAGGGTIVPITGFANSVVSPAIEAKTEGFILGVGAKIFTVAGPVIVYGVLSSIIVGIGYYIFYFIY